MKISRYMRMAIALPIMLVGFQGAQAANGTTDSTADIRQPVTINKDNDLDFGTFIPGTTRSVFRLNPNNDNLSQRNGDAIAFGGTPTAAAFTVSGTPNLRVRITSSQNRIDIIRDGGTETMRVNRFRFDGARNRFLSAAGEVVYRVGGQVRVGANQAAGTYRGNFSITVDYF